MQNNLISTEQLAAKFLVKPNTIRSAFCRDGHYLKLVPVKMANGRLGWPSESLEQSHQQEAK